MYPYPPVNSTVTLVTPLIDTLVVEDEYDVGLLNDVPFTFTVGHANHPSPPANDVVLGNNSILVIFTVVAKLTV